MTTVEALSGLPAYQQFVAGDGLRIVEFWAPWCGPCLRLSPTLDKLAASAGAPLIRKVNSDEEADVVLSQGVMGLPTIQFYRDGELVKSHSGGIPEFGLNKIISELAV